MSQLLLQLLGSTGHFVEIKPFAGSPRRGRLRPADSQSSLSSPSSAVGSIDLPEVTLDPVDGSPSAPLDWTKVKAIELLHNPHQESNPEVRFFDSTEVAPFLWIRLTLTNGEALEGKVENSISLLCSQALVLYPLEEYANRRCMCVPRSAIADLQVVTLRQ